MNEDEDKQINKLKMLAKDAERKRKKRLAYSEEKKEEIKEKQKLYARSRRMSMSSDQLDESRRIARDSAKERRSLLTDAEQNQIKEQNKEKMRERRANLTEEEHQQITKQIKEKMRKRRANLTEEEHQQITEQKKEKMRKKRANLSEEELNTTRRQNRKRMSERRTCSNEVTYNSVDNEDDITSVQHNVNILDINTPLLVDICSSVEKENCTIHCQELLSRTLLTPDCEDYKEGLFLHKSLVCVVCDRCVTGRESFHWISKTLLLFHKNVLSYKYFYGGGINDILKAQYSLSDPELADLLLSPRTWKKKTDGFYMCCQHCYNHLAEPKPLKKPPKYAISNGFAIGHLPHEIATNMTPLVNNLVAPIRAFNYFLSFSGGREQKITGNFTFFAQDVAQNMGALQYTSSANNNPCVFIVLIGSFTPRQLDKIKTQGTYHVETFRKVYNFLHANNEHYSGLPSVEHVPLPQVEQVRVNQDEEVVADSPHSNEEECICWKYWFPATGDPDTVSGIHTNQSDFARALFVGETPTLFYHPTKIFVMPNWDSCYPLHFHLVLGM